MLPSQKKRDSPVTSWHLASMGVTLSSQKLSGQLLMKMCILSVHLPWLKCTGPLPFPMVFGYPQIMVNMWFRYIPGLQTHLWEPSYECLASLPQLHLAHHASGLKMTSHRGIKTFPKTQCGLNQVTSTCLLSSGTSFSTPPPFKFIICLFLRELAHHLPYMVPAARLKIPWAVAWASFSYQPSTIRQPSKQKMVN